MKKKKKISVSDLITNKEKGMVKTTNKKTGRETVTYDQFPHVIRDISDVNITDGPDKKKKSTKKKDKDISFD